MTSAPRLAAVPKGGWKQCRGCEESFAELLPSGCCPSCDVALRRELELAVLPERREQLLRSCRVPRRYAATSFIEPSRWPGDGRRGSLADWRGRPWSVTVTGDVGTGKTMMAVELLWRDIVHCRKSGTKGEHLFVRGADAVSIAFGRESDCGFAQLVRCRFLLLDDLGAGISGEAWGALDRLIGARYDDELRTVVTSNLGAGAMTDLHDGGARIADRLSDGIWVRLSGDSRRG